MASTTCVRCDGVGEHRDPADEGNTLVCGYCKGTGKRVWLLTQNSELRPFGIYNWTLPAFVVQLSNGKHFNVCPHAGICASVCYALNGTYKFPSVRQAHTNKLEMTLYDLDGWLDVMDNELSHPRYKGKWVRIHDGGDFYNADYLQAWLHLARAHPDVRFYCYTKEVTMFRQHVERGVTVRMKGEHYLAEDGSLGWVADRPEDARRAALAGRLPANFYYLYSMGGKEDALIDKDVDRHADIFKSEETMAAAGYSSQEGDDTQCVTLPNHRIGIVENNIPAFKKIMAGRTFAEMQEERDAKKRSKLERLASDPETAEPAPVVVAPEPDWSERSADPVEPVRERYVPQNHKPDLPPVAEDQGTLF